MRRSIRISFPAASSNVSRLREHWLFDEPTSALDPELVTEVLKVIEELAREGMTMIIVTHEINFAFRISDRIVFMEAGTIVSDASPHELAALDKTSRIASFLKDVHIA
jgi:polar amino acid transport system permease protein